MTDGLAQLVDGSGTGSEFCLVTSVNDALHIETLAMVASFHVIPQHRLVVGKVLEIGRPLLEGSRHDHLLVSLPYPFGETFERFTVDGHPGRIRWLLPISATEAAYARERGSDALEKRLEAAGADYLRLDRPSVA